MITQQKLLLSPEEIANSPSSELGMTVEDEFDYRCFACELVREGQILLNLSPVVGASGQTLCHRFYYFFSFAQYHPFFVAMTCLFIGSKIEEELRPIIKTIQVFHRMYQRRIGQDISPLQETNPMFLRWRTILMNTEKLVLSTFGYHIYGITDHPHRYILFFIKKLGCDEATAQRAWNILNDSLQLPLCLQYSANSIACAAIFLAALTLGIVLPQKVEWWVLFDSSLDDIQNISQSITRLYSRKRIEWLPDVQPPKQGECTLITTLEKSRVVSPTVEMIHYIEEKNGFSKVKIEPVKQVILDKKPTNQIVESSRRSRSRSRNSHSSHRSHNSHRSHGSHHSHHSHRSHSHRKHSRSRSRSRDQQRRQ